MRPLKISDNPKVSHLIAMYGHMLYFTWLYGSSDPDAGENIWSYLNALADLKGQSIEKCFQDLIHDSHCAFLVSAGEGSSPDCPKCHRNLLKLQLEQFEQGLAVKRREGV